MFSANSKIIGNSTIFFYFPAHLAWDVECATQTSPDSWVGVKLRGFPCPKGAYYRRFLPVVVAWPRQWFTWGNWGSQTENMSCFGVILNVLADAISGIDDICCVIWNKVNAISEKTYRRFCLGSMCLTWLVRIWTQREEMGKEGPHRQVRRVTLPVHCTDRHRIVNGFHCFLVFFKGISKGSITAVEERI